MDLRIAEQREVLDEKLIEAENRELIDYWSEFNGDTVLFYFDTNGLVVFYDQDTKKILPATDE